MDYAAISEASGNVSSRRLKSAHTVRLSSKPVKSRRTRAAAFDLSIATEEVVEAVFSGSTYVPVTGVMDPASPSHSESGEQVNRKTCYVVLDIAQEDDWVYCFPVGSWRRIVMNIFGNAYDTPDMKWANCYVLTGNASFSIQARHLLSIACPFLELC
jgi:hypothetical protein